MLSTAGLLLLVVSCGEVSKSDSGPPDSSRPDAALPDVGDKTGKEGGPCYPNGTCNTGLKCLSKVCVRMPDGGMPDMPVPDQAIPDVRALEAMVPDQAMPEAQVPDLSAPDLPLPDIQVPDQLLPDILSPDMPWPTCTDKSRNGTETDIDCGGNTCPKCADGKDCLKAADCTSAVCTSKVCQAPTCTDKVQNGSETDVDCGGGACGKCSHGATCKLPGDCASGACTSGTCDSCGDGLINGTDQCDGTAFGGKTCQTLGWKSGTGVLKCDSKCKLRQLGCVSKGLVAYYPLDSASLKNGTVSAVSGKVTALGSAKGVSAVAPGSCVVGECATLSGSKYIDLGWGKSLATIKMETSGSVCLWFKEQANNSTKGYVLTREGSPTVVINYPSANGLAAEIVDSDSGTTPQLAKTGMSKAWHHICLTWDGVKNDGRIWLDGQESTSWGDQFKNGLYKSPKTLTNWLIGAAFDQKVNKLSYFLSGWIDEVLLWDYQLDKQTILKLYNSGKGVVLY